MEAYIPSISQDFKKDQRSYIVMYLPDVGLLLPKCINCDRKSIYEKGSGCSTPDNTVASDTKGPRFESRHKQPLLDNDLLLTVCRKDYNNGPF